MTLAAQTPEARVADPIHEIMELQMGPSHPASHGTIKFNLKLDGETIVDCDVEIGYLHRGFEKMCEQGTWTQCIPYTDRLNYASPLINNVGFALTVEKLLGHPSARARAVDPHADVRDLAHHRPPHLPRHGRHGGRCVHGRALHQRGARVCSTTSSKPSPARGSR